MRICVKQTGATENLRICALRIIEKIVDLRFADWRTLNKFCIPTIRILFFFLLMQKVPEPVNMVNLHPNIA
jgi:hypothetical protein